MGIDLHLTQIAAFLQLVSKQTGLSLINVRLSMWCDYSNINKHIYDFCTALDMQI